MMPRAFLAQVVGVVHRVVMWCFLLLGHLTGVALTALVSAPLSQILRASLVGVVAVIFVLYVLIPLLVRLLVWLFELLVVVAVVVGLLLFLRRLLGRGEPDSFDGSLQDWWRN